MRGAGVRKESIHGPPGRHQSRYAGSKGREAMDGGCKCSRQRAYTNPRLPPPPPPPPPPRLVVEALWGAGEADEGVDDGDEGAVLQPLRPHKQPQRVRRHRLRARARARMTAKKTGWVWPALILVGARYAIVATRERGRAPRFS